MADRDSSMPRLTEIEVVAAAATLAWLVIGGLVLWAGSGAAAGVPGLRLLALGLPVAMIWLAAVMARSLRGLRGDLARIEAALAALSRLPRDTARPVPANGAPATAAAQSASQPTPRPAAPASAGPAAPAVQPQAAPPPAVIRPIDDQPSLALGAEAEAAPLERADLIRALNFPESDQDTAGFSALRRALKDRRARQLIQAAQDMLTLLSQDGIYTDDLRPDRARPEIWRRFAQGERGRSVAQLGGIHDRSCLGLTMNRMREDTIFRDTAHHFLRLFDRMLTAFEPEASDAEIAALAETRTARAFMLLGRVTGAFD